jgi:hypothetical protein
MEQKWKSAVYLPWAYFESAVLGFESEWLELGERCGRSVSEDLETVPGEGELRDAAE